MRFCFVFALLITASFLSSDARGQQLVYQPINPAFGGSPLNYSWLFSSAQTQNRFEGDNANPFERNALADFEQSLQRQVLNQLSRELIFNRFNNLDLTQAGTFDFGDFQVEIIPGIEGVSVRIFNILTGEETTVTIPGGTP